MLTSSLVQLDSGISLSISYWTLPPPLSKVWALKLNYYDYDSQQASLTWSYWYIYLQREFTAMREQYMRSGEGFLICYSVTDRRSFNEIKEYSRLIKRVRCLENIPILLVGNKVDLSAKRQVSFWQIVQSRSTSNFLLHFQLLSLVRQ